MATKMNRKPPASAVKAKAPKQKPDTLEETGALDFEPWRHDETFELPGLAEIEDPHLLFCRVAFELLHKPKEELVEIFKNTAHGNLIFEVMEHLEDSQKFFTGLAALLNIAHARLLVAGASYAVTA